jgi:hypothetical protein
MQAEISGYDLSPIHSIKVSSYLTAETTQGLAITEQPRRQYYWHRPLHALFNAAFATGLFLDRLEEPRITSDTPQANPLNWANFDMPPLLFARLRKL